LYATIYGHLKVVKFLVKEAEPRADAELKDFGERTPLSLIALLGHLDMV